MIQTTNGVILRSTLFRETSRLLTFFTEDFGKIHTLAKGVRRRPDRFGSTFDLFSCNRIVFYERSRSDLQLLSQCDLIDPFVTIRSDLKKMAYGVYFTELVDRSTELGDRSGRMYALLLEALREVSKRERLEETARIFEVKLLSLLGLMPELSRCQECGGRIVIPPALSLRKGGLLCGRCVEDETGVLQISKGTLASLQHLLSSSWELAYRIRISRRCHEELREILKCFIDFHLDEKIHSRDFLKELETL